jgi:uncharacterized protein YbaP (TraB family)
MKTIALFLFSLVFTFGIAQPAAPEKWNLLWEVRSPRSGEPSYLFGTMHSTDSRVFQLPDSVWIAIEKSAGFALEVDFDSASYLTLEYLYAQHGEDIFDEDSWMDNARSWDGEDKPAPRRPDPADLFKFFERDDVEEEETFLDAFLYRVARERGKTITGLEDILDQLAMLTGEDLNAETPDEENPAVGKRTRLGEMLTVYENGDLDKLEQMVNTGATSKFFKEEVIVKRNYGMAKQADSLIRIRPTFIGVGAAHLPGKEGVIHLLRERGYTLRPVKATYTGLNKTYLEKPYSPQWTTFRREGDGYQLDLPTRPFALDILDGQIKMYLGMDYPGGMVYCFYALPLPEDAGMERMEEVGKAMVKGFGSSNIDEDATKDIDYKGIQGKEYVIQKSGEHLRVRILFGNGRLYMLLMGNSEQVITSDAAEHWFNSLETFPAKRLTEQTPYPVRDATNGFSLTFLGEPDHRSHHVGSFTTGGDENHFDVYENRDRVHRQRMLFLTEDFKDWYAVSRLEGRMADCIHYYASAELEPVVPLMPVETDGVKGLEGIYVGESGLKYRIRAYIRLNRLYLLGFTLPEEEDPIGSGEGSTDGAIVDTIFNSLHFLPVAQPSLHHAIHQPGQFEAKLPGKPHHIDNDDTDFGFLGDIDSAWTLLHHDPHTSLNTSVSVGRIWEFYSGTDAELLKDASQGSMADSGIVVSDHYDSNGAWNTRHMVIQSYDSTMLDHYHWVVTGGHLLEARIQTTNDAAGKATAASFFQQFRPAPNTGKDTHNSPKLRLLLERYGPLDSADFLAALVIRAYKVRPGEYELLFDSIRAIVDTVEYGFEEELIDLALKVEDADIQARLKALYEFLPPGSHHRIQIVNSLLLRDWPGAKEWALARLREKPSPLSYAAETFGWYDHLLHDHKQQDGEWKQLKSILFLLDDPDHALALAGEMCQFAMYEDADFSAWHGQFHDILSRAMDQYDPADPKNWRKTMQMDHVINHLSAMDVPGWTDLAKRMFTLEESYLPGLAFMLLADNDRYPTKKELKLVMESRDSRGMALNWILDNRYLSTLPAKYRDPGYVALVMFEFTFEEMPERVELVDKHKVEFLDEEHWLYVYKFAVEGNADWMLGFSGPFPLKGEPEDGYFELAGSNWDEYHPNSYVKKMKAWVRSAEAEAYGE